MGNGKTLLATHFALKAINRGVPVYANYEIAGAVCVDDMVELFARSLPDIDPVTREVVRDECGNIPERLLIIDEANITCPSRYWAKLDPRMLYYWSQSRKLGLTIYWTAQHERRVDAALREITYRIWHCRRFGRLHVATACLPDEQSKTRRTWMGRKYLWRSQSLCDAYNTLRLVELGAQVCDLDGPDWRASLSEQPALSLPVDRKGRLRISK
jgi:hypothetical protein